MSRLFVLSFEDDAVRKVHRVYFLLKVEIKEYDRWQNIFHQPVNNDLSAYDNIPKVAKVIIRNKKWYSSNFKSFIKED